MARLRVLKEHSSASKTYYYIQLRFDSQGENGLASRGPGCTPGKVLALLLHLQLQVDRRGSLLGLLDRVGVLAGFV
jgi:hypothetical protein